jgi:non-haem Fe2+, alpha-ketoglutarate-dependent halogenase
VKILTARQAKQYHDEGASYPIRVFSQERAAHYLAELEKGEATYGQQEFRKILRTKGHLVLKWMDEIAHDERVLDAVEDIIGPDILLYNISVWIKNARDSAYVGWHQDSLYFPLEPAVQITAWVALTDSVAENGNVKYLPGSQKLGLLKHGEQPQGGSMLSKGQHIVAPLVTDNVKSISLQPGEMSLHHTNVVHYSEPNHSNRRRIGIGVSYIPTSVRCTSKVRHAAMLVRGVDKYNYFDHEPRVRSDLDPEAVTYREKAIARFNEARYQQRSGLVE